MDVLDSCIIIIFVTDDMVKEGYLPNVFTVFFITKTLKSGYNPGYP